LAKVSSDIAGIYVWDNSSRRELRHPILSRISVDDEHSNPSLHLAEACGSLNLCLKLTEVTASGKAHICIVVEVGLVEIGLGWLVTHTMNEDYLVQHPASKNFKELGAMCEIKSVLATFASCCLMDLI
jgi:hypothetical protein